MTDKEIPNDEGVRERCAARAPNACGLLCLCAGMTLLFVAFQEAQNAAPQRISEAGLGDFGFYTLANFYFSLLLGNQVAPYFIQRMSGRVTLPIAAVGFVLFIASLLTVSHLPRKLIENAPVAIAVMVQLVTLLSGLIGGLLWPSQGYVLTHYAPEHLLNWYMSIFSLCFFASGFLGPAVVAPELLTGPDNLVAPVTLLVLAISGVLFLCALPSDGPAGDASDDSEGLRSRSSRSPRAVGPARLLWEAPARRLGFVALAEGWCLNAFVSVVPPILTASWIARSDSSFHEKFQLVLLMNGFGHIAASLLYAPLANRFGRQVMVFFQALVCLLTAALANLDLLFGNGSDALDVGTCALSTGFFLGFGIIMARTNNSAICAHLYRERAGSAFAFLASARGLVSILGLLLLPTMSSHWPKLAVTGSLGWLLVASLCAGLHQPLFGVQSERAELEGESESTEDV